jgi:Flp pilus assembly protein TadB
MSAVYKDADRQYGEQLNKSWLAIVAVISAVMLFAIIGGGAPAIYTLPAIVGVIVGPVAWWQRRKSMDADGMLMEKARQWFDARGYRVRPGGAYEKKFG